MAQNNAYFYSLTIPSHALSLSILNMLKDGLSASEKIRLLADWEFVGFTLFSGRGRISPCRMRGLFLMTPGSPRKPCPGQCSSCAASELLSCIADAKFRDQAMWWVTCQRWNGRAFWLSPGTCTYPGGIRQPHWVVHIFQQTRSTTLMSSSRTLKPGVFGSTFLSGYEFQQQNWLMIFIAKTSTWPGYSLVYTWERGMERSPPRRTELCIDLALLFCFSPKLRPVCSAY